MIWMDGKLKVLVHFMVNVILESVIRMDIPLRKNTTIMLSNSKEIDFIPWMITRIYGQERHTKRPVKNREDI